MSESSPAYEPAVPAAAAYRPGVTAHYSRMSGRWTVVADVDITAAELTNAMSTYLPGDVRLIEATSHAGATLWTFQGEPDQGKAPISASGA